MRQLQAVIGAQYGDEGKGLLVDYLSNHLTLVVRFNGGAQAGHTVTLPDGRRHVFHHFGSGCFKAACTMLSRFFIVNPILYRQEHESSSLRGIRKTVFIDQRAIVTTPIDMMLNVLAEDKRGHLRHGSCGMGINETVTRSQQEVHRVTVQDLLTERVASVRDRVSEYGRWRADLLSVHLPSDALLKDVFDRWADDVRYMLKTAQAVFDGSGFIAESPHVVFEGAQGLRLDEHAPGFPHVTRSRTGLNNVEALLGEAGLSIEPLEAIYVTRAYTTRHGAGPLDGEVDGHPYGWAGPETNVENPHQGRFRYAPLDPYELSKAIHTDYRTSRPVRQSLAVTCLDQLPTGEERALRTRILEATPIPQCFLSYGPTRKDVIRLTYPRPEVVHG